MKIISKGLWILILETPNSYFIIWRSHFISSREIIELLKVSELEIFSKWNSNIFNTPCHLNNGRSHVIFSPGFYIWKEFEFKEIRNAKMKVWESPFIPSHLTFKSFKFPLNFTQSINQNYLFNITFQNLEFWVVTTI